MVLRPAKKTVTCPPGRAFNKKRLTMKKLLLIPALVLAICFAMQSTANAGFFISFPIPVPVPVFWGPRPVYYGPGPYYYYRPYGWYYYHRPYYWHGYYCR
jgi:hypothetical protein